MVRMEGYMLLGSKQREHVGRYVGYLEHGAVKPAVVGLVKKFVAAAAAAAAVVEGCNSSPTSSEPGKSIPVFALLFFGVSLVLLLPCPGLSSAFH